MSSDLDRTYGHRFSEADARAKESIWREITRYLQRFVTPEARVLDIACDRGHFIKNITAAEKWATDLRDVSESLDGDVRFTQCDGLRVADHLPADYFDVVFMSNYLEHLSTRPDVISQFRAARAVLRPGGRVLVLQPNIQLCGAAYWDFIDHQVPLTAQSLVEAGEIAGLRTLRVIQRFLPYTTKSRIPQHPVLVRAYLAFPPLWYLLGKQTLYLGERPS